MTRSPLVALASAALVLLPLRHARGDWPMARHDAQRTAAAAGSSNITTPETRWRYYLGGSLSAAGALALDLDDNGVEEYVMVAGGALVARRFDDTVAWTAPPRDFQRLVGASDLDGDGDRELVVAGARGVAVLDARTGAIAWETPAARVPALGGARLADLDGDGLDDLLVIECGTCCAVGAGEPGTAYGFADSLDAPTELWRMPVQTCGMNNSLTLFDADGDGDLEVLAGLTTGYQLVDGTTGTVVASSPAMGQLMHTASCRPVDVDGTTGDELVCVHSATQAAERSVFLLDLVGDTLQPTWRHFVANEASADLRVLDLATHLGDGWKAVLSTRPGPDAPWTTRVFDAVTGAVEPSLDGELVAGTAPRPAGGRYLVTLGAAGLRGWRSVAGALVPAWTRAGDDEPVVRVDLDAARVSTITSLAATLPDSGRLLVTPRSRPHVLRVLDLGDGGAGLAAELEVPLGVRIAAAFVTPRIAARPLAIARTDGFLVPLDEGLVPQLGLDDVQVPGIRTGGYYAPGGWRQLTATPRSADLDGDGRDEVLATDSRGTLQRLDAEDASLTVAPSPRWVVADATAPTVTTGPDGAPALACLERDLSEPLVPRYEVAMRSADGAVAWTRALDGWPVNDPVRAALTDDAIDDVIVQWQGNVFAQVKTLALDGASGQPLWEDVIEPGWGPQPAGVSYGPWPGEARGAVLYAGATRITALSGATGLPATQSPPIGVHYFLPMLAELDDDADREVVLTGGYHPVHVLDHDLAPRWISDDGAQRPYPYGALARCPDGRAVLVSESWGLPARVSLTTVSGPTPGATQHLWLAGGSAYPDADALAAAGAWAGQLTSSTVHEDLSGLGRPSALLGSSDGYLYLLDPCAGALDAAVAFPAAVGEAVYADTDGDGRDEILVTAGDGNLHVLQQRAVAAPAEVRDVTAATGDAVDADTLLADTVPAAAWEPVDGADGYEAALVDGLDRYVTDPPWRPVAGTRVAFTDAPVAAGEVRRVLVRAVSPDGRSVETASDGVVGVAPDPVDEPPDPPPAAGCCDGGADGRGPAALALAVLAALAWPGRRRRRARA